MTRGAVVTLLVVAGALAGVLLAVGACRDAQHDAAIAAYRDSVTASATRARAAEATARAEAGRRAVSEAARAASEAARQADSARWATARAALLQRLAARPATLPAVVAAPDTCRPAIAALLDQIALTDSLGRLDRAGAARDKASLVLQRDSLTGEVASLTRDLGTAQQQWRHWQHLATTAPVRPRPRLVAAADARLGIGAPSELAAEVRTRLRGVLWATGQGAAQWDSLTARPRLGARVGLRVEGRLW